MKKERYLVPAYGPDINVLKVALQTLEVLGAKLNSAVAIVVPALKHADSTILNKVVPEKQLKSLIKGGTLTLGDSNIPLSLVSQKTLNNTKATIFLGVFASEKMIQKIESSVTCKALIIPPWAGELDVEEWEKKWSPTILDLNEKNSEFITDRPR